jgi:hypothetical protein
MEWMIWVFVLSVMGLFFGVEGVIAGTAVGLFYDALQYYIRRK